MGKATCDFAVVRMGRGGDVPAPEEADAGGSTHLVRRSHHPVSSDVNHIHRDVGYTLACIHKQLATHLEHDRVAHFISLAHCVPRLGKQEFH